MTSWRPQHYIQAGQKAGIDPTLLANAAAAGQAVIDVNYRLPPILTLRHLAYLTEVNYGMLRKFVRRSGDDPYRAFHIRKRPGIDGKKRYRIICVPDYALLRIQKWIAQRILAIGQPHPASTAYAKGNSILNAAARHCGATWLIKLDVHNFFESISEISVYRVFRQLGYQALPAFEMARICTRNVPVAIRYRGRRWRCNPKKYKIHDYNSRLLGHLPQGAPTSPMLANFAVRKLDVDLTKIANSWGLRYSRYADDISLSAHNNFDRVKARKVIGEVYGALSRHGLSPNRAKAAVSGPGSRKIVLGLLVDSDKPHLTREFKANLRMHLYYMLHGQVGPSAHAARRGFAAVAGLRHHLQGLIAYARQIDPEYAEKREAEFAQIAWPI